MQPAQTYQDIIRSLEYDLDRDPTRVQIVGLVFCRPQLAFAKEHLLPSLPYFHQRSGKRVTFFFAGFRKDTHAEGPYEYRVQGPEDSWIFSERYFNRMRYDVEQSTKWQYSGGNDFILANARYDSQLRGAYIDYRGTISMALDEAFHDNPAELSKFFERIFRCGDHALPQDPVAAISNTMGKGLLVNAAKDALIAALPEGARKSATAGFNHAIRNIEAEDSSFVHYRLRRHIPEFRRQQ